MHLVGFIARIYHNARSSERQTYASRFFESLGGSKKLCQTDCGMLFTVNKSVLSESVKRKVHLMVSVVSL